MKNYFVVSVLATFISSYSLACQLSESSQADSCQPIHESIRIMAANLSSGNNQKYEDDHGIKLLNAFDADVILVQEFNYGEDVSAPDSAEQMVAKLTNSEAISYVFYREPMTTGITIPNGVISKFPILAGGEIEDVNIGQANSRTRSFVWAKIDIPGSIDLWAFSLHLKSGDKSKDKGKRNNQTLELIRILKEHKFVTPQHPDGETIPEKDYVVMGGDFNTYNINEQTFQNLSVYFPIPVGEDGLFDMNFFPKGDDGKIGTNSNRNSPYDQVLADTDLVALETAVIMGDESFPHGYVFDCRIENKDIHLEKIETTTCETTNMQHMPVIRDYLIPLN